MILSRDHKINWLAFDMYSRTKQSHLTVGRTTKVQQACPGSARYIFIKTRFEYFIVYLVVIFIFWSMSESQILSICHVGTHSRNSNYTLTRPICLYFIDRPFRPSYNAICLKFVFICLCTINNLCISYNLL